MNDAPLAIERLIDDKYVIVERHDGYILYDARNRDQIIQFEGKYNSAVTNPQAAEAADKIEIILEKNDFHAFVTQMIAFDKYEVINIIGERPLLQSYGIGPIFNGVPASFRIIDSLQDFWSKFANPNSTRPLPKWLKLPTDQAQP